MNNMKDARERIDPELAEALKAVPMTPAGVFDLSDLEGTRAGVRAFAEAIAAQMPDEPSVSVEQVEVPRPDGSTLPIRLLRPAEAAGPLPVLLWFHGGGQVLGYAAQDDPHLKRLCLEVSGGLVSVSTNEHGREGSRLCCGVDAPVTLVARATGELALPVAGPADQLPGQPSEPSH